MVRFGSSRQLRLTGRNTLVGGLVCCVVVATHSPATLAQTSLPRLPAAPTAPAAVERGYILGGGDRVRLDIFDVAEYSGEYDVLVDGTLNLPMAGPVPVQGLTLEQASRAISSRYAPFLRRPIVTVSLIKARPVVVAIAGEVNRPGSFNLSTATGTVSSLTNALRQAGGITQTADIRRVQIRRLQPGSTGAIEMLTVNLWQLLAEADLRQDLLLRDGDTIVIPTATAANPNEARMLANTGLAADQSEPIQIAVVGQVNRPGPHTLSAATAAQGETNGTLQVPTVTQAIQVAGGITQTADIRKIQVRRMTRLGQEQIIPVDFWQLLRAGDLNQDLPLQEGDTVVIPTAVALSPSETTEITSASFSPSEMTVNVVGQVVSPGSIVMRPNTPLNQAILAAGGFNNRARRGRVQLIRLNPDGTVAQRDIEVDFASGVSGDRNPPLRPNDTIVVGRSGLAAVSDTLGTLLAPVTGVFGLFRLLGL